MMIDKKGHKCRNIQEQVGKNTCDIKELKERIPTEDYVVKATKSEDERTLHIKQRVEGVEQEFDFQGGDNLIAGDNINIEDTEEGKVISTPDLIAGVNVAIEETEEGKVISATTEPVGSVSWGGIAGTLANQTDLKTELDGKVTLGTEQNITGTKKFLNVSYGHPTQFHVGPNTTSAWIGFTSGQLAKGSNDGTVNTRLDVGSTSGTIAVTSQVNAKQDTLVSGTNIKTINSQSVLGAGNISINTGVMDVKVNNVSVVDDGIANIDNVTFLNNDQTITGQKKFHADKGIIVGTSNPSTQYLNNKLIYKVDNVDVNTISYPNKSGTMALTSDITSYHDNTKQDVLTAGDNITIEDNVISATGGGEPEQYIKQIYNTNNGINWKDQDGAIGSLFLKTINSNSIIGNGDIQITGEPEEYIKSASVSGNTLILTNQDDEEIGFTPSAEGGITDVKVNGSSVVTEGVANINIAEDAVITYDMSVNPQTMAITINTPNQYNKITSYLTQYGKYPLIYLVVHIPTQPDIAVTALVYNTGTALQIRGVNKTYVPTQITNQVVTVTTTSTTQSATLTEHSALTSGTARVARADINHNVITFENESKVTENYEPTFENLPDKPNMDDYQLVTSLDSAVTALGYIKGITYSDIEDNLEGSDFISVDYNEDDEKLQVSFDFTNLDQFIEFPSSQPEVVLSWTSDSPAKLQATLNQTVSNKINNSLQLPLTHTEETLVGVDTTGAQEQLKIGSGLSVVNGALTATGGSEVHLYEHNIILYNRADEEPFIQFTIYFKIINNSPQPLNISSLLSYLPYKSIGVSGYIFNNNLETILGVPYVIMFNNDKIDLLGIKFTGEVEQITNIPPSEIFVGDTNIVQII